MSSCLETEALVTLASLAEDPEALLQHVVTCDECRAGFAEIGATSRSLRQSIEPRVGFTNAVMSTLPPVEAPQESRSGATERVVGEVGQAAQPGDAARGGAPDGSSLWWIAHGGLAAMAGVFASAAAGTAAPEGGGAPIVFIAVAAGLAGILLPAWRRSGSTT